MLFCWWTQRAGIQFARISKTKNPLNISTAQMPHPARMCIIYKEAQEPKHQQCTNNRQDAIFRAQMQGPARAKVHPPHFFKAYWGEEVSGTCCPAWLYSWNLCILLCTSNRCFRRRYALFSYTPIFAFSYTSNCCMYPFIFHTTHLYDITQLKLLQLTLLLRRLQHFPSTHHPATQFFLLLFLLISPHFLISFIFDCKPFITIEIAISC